MNEKQDLPDDLKVPDDTAPADAGQQHEDGVSAADLEAQIRAKLGEDEDGAVVETAPQVPEATAEDKKDLPPALTREQKDAFIRERINARKERERLAKAQPAPVEQPPAQPRVATPPPSEDTGPKTADDYSKVYLLRAQAQRSIDGYPVKGMDPAKASEILALSDSVLGGLTDEAIALEILERARTGALGEFGSDVQEQIRADLPVINARLRQQAMQQEKQNAERQATVARFTAAGDEVHAKYPDLKDAKSEAAQFVQRWWAENVGDVQNPRDLIAMTFSSPDGFKKTFDLAMNAYKADRASRTEAELKMLKQRVSRGQQPVGGAGSPPGDGTATAKESDKILSELQQRNPGFSFA